jgi:hypothetical protein
MPSRMTNSPPARTHVKTRSSQGATVLSCAQITPRVDLVDLHLRFKEFLLQKFPDLDEQCAPNLARMDHGQKIPLTK